MRTPLAFPLMLSVSSALAAGCSASTGGCQPTTCETQGFQCGSFVDVCGTLRDCGTCAIGTCTKADGTAGVCQLPGTLPPAGNPDGSCSQPLPPEALPEDTSTPTTVVGTGTAASCTDSALAAAVARGGVVTFDCGPEPVTIPVTATLEFQTDRHTVIDGGNRVTLEVKSSDPTLEVRLETLHAGRLDVIVHPLPGAWANVTEGDGWRLVATGPDEWNPHPRLRRLGLQRRTPELSGRHAVGDLRESQASAGVPVRWSDLFGFHVEPSLSSGRW